MCSLWQMNKNSSPLDPKQQVQSLNARLVAGLVKVAELVRVLQWDKAKRHNLSPVQLSILSFLAYHAKQSHTISSLALEFTLTKATISDSVRTLVEKGLVERTPDTNDSRSHQLKLSQAARPIVADLDDQLNPLTATIDALPPGHIESLWEVVADMLRTAVATRLISPPRMCYFCQYYQPEGDAFYCRLLEQRLSKGQVRLDCPEYSSASQEA